MPPVEAPLAGRWRLVAPIGAGTAGTVYRAEDLRTGAVVAVKVLADATPRRAGRFDREARALRRLGVPGVVRLLDAGEHEARRYLVTELIDGAPFPGAPAPVPWARLRATAVQLLETLAAVHAAGVLHRDLKPANVLVDRLGRPTVLDFGLARVSGEHSLTRTGDVLGTPRYQAPEQILGDHPVDARTDLYAVGVMLYEALAGRPPQATRSVGRVYAARLVREAPPLLEVAPDVPPAVAQVVDRLVTRAPEGRPGSARAVLAALAAAVPARPVGALPWLGPTHPVEAVRAALAAGRPVAVVGPRGSGRTRVLEEVAKARAAEGRACVSVPAGERPLESLAGALGTEIPDPEAARAAVAAHVAAGDAFFVDDEVDPWSAACLVEAGPVVLAREEPAGEEAVPLAPLDADALAPLFTGPAREARAGAALLLARTGGLPARVAAEVGRWVTEGLAAWTAQGLRFPPEARFVVEAGPPPDVRLGRRGRLPLPPALDVALAWIVLAEPWATTAGLAAARGRPAWEVEAEIRELVAIGAVERRSDGVAARADLATVDAGVDRHAALRALADALPAGAPGRMGRLCAAEAWGPAVEEGPPLAEAALRDGDAARAFGTAAWAVEAASRGDCDAAAPVEILARAAAAIGTPGALRAAAERVDRVAPHLAGAHRARAEAMRTWLLAGAPAVAGDALDRRVEQADAWLAAGDLERAFAEAEAARRDAEPLGRLRTALHAAAVARDARVRAGRGGEPSPAAVVEAETVGRTDLLARVCLVEASAAWRLGRYDEAARLARRAAAAAPDTPAGALGVALGLVGGSGSPPDACVTALATADRLGDPRVSLEARGLVALVAPARAAALLPEAEALAARLPRLPDTGAVLSPAEALAFCRAHARRSPSG